MSEIRVERHLPPAHAERRRVLRRLEDFRRQPLNDAEERRFQAAIAAMNGLCAIPAPTRAYDPHQLARRAVRIADALLAELNLPQETCHAREG